MAKIPSYYFTPRRRWWQRILDRVLRRKSFELGMIAFDKDDITKPIGVVVGKREDGTLLIQMSGCIHDMTREQINKASTVLSGDDAER